MQLHRAETFPVKLLFDSRAMRLTFVAVALALAGAHGAVAHSLVDRQVTSGSILDGPRTQNILASKFIFTASVATSSLTQAHSSDPWSLGPTSTRVHSPKSDVRH